MLDLPEILKRTNCKPIFEFFNISDSELLIQTKCSIENYIESDKID
jgi:hypothetical protein